MDEQELMNNDFYLHKTNLKNIKKTFRKTEKRNKQQEIINLTIGTYQILKKTHDKRQREEELETLIALYIDMNRRFDYINQDSLSIYDVINYYEDVFRAAKIIDVMQDSVQVYGNDLIGDARLMLERDYFRKMGVLKNNPWSGEDMAFMSIVFDNQNIDEIYGDRVHDSSDFLYKMMRNKDTDSLLYSYAVATNLDFQDLADEDYYFLFTSRIADYGYAVALTDSSWKLPKAQTQRFVENNLGLNSNKIVIGKDGNIIQ